VEENQTSLSTDSRDQNYLTLCTLSIHDTFIFIIKILNVYNNYIIISIVFHGC
jgi:hypothetical protein